MLSSVAVCQHFKMRVLIVAALFACASAAPSGLIHPVVAYPAVTYGAAVNSGDLQAALIDAKVIETRNHQDRFALNKPSLVVRDDQDYSDLIHPVVAYPAVTYGAAVNSGDLQAALIDAKVQTEDYLRSVADKQREAFEKAGVAVNTPVAYTAAVNAPVAYAAAPVAAVNAPVAYSAAPVAFQAAAIPAVAAVNSGDFNAALIDAKVKTEDYLRSIVDQQREAVETAVVDTNEKVIEANDQIQEKAAENFWSEQDKKWQAVSAVQTAEAQLDGAIASTSDAVAKSIVSPAIAPVVAPYNPYIYTPGVVAPGLVALKEAPKEEKPEENAALVKEAPKEEKPEEAKSDSVQVESANVKTGEAEKSEAFSSVTETKYVVGQTPLVASFPLSPLRFAAQPYVVPSSFVPFGTQYVAPTVVKTVW